MVLNTVIKMQKNEFFLNFYTNVLNTNKANVALTGTLKLGYKFRTNFNADNEDYLFSYYLTGNINTPTNADYVFMLTLLNDGGSDRIQLAFKVTSSQSYAKIYFRSKGTGDFTDWTEK